ncbi:MAG: CHASE2 domain-containing protein [Armatimonadota bacterium]
MAIGLLALLAAARLGPLRALEMRTVDWRLSRPHRAPPLDAFVIVAMRKDTFESGRLRRWGPASLHRAEYIPVIEHLAQWGARAIGMDVFFAGASDDPDTDAALAQAIATAGNVVVVAGAKAQLEAGAERTAFALPARPIAQAARVVASPLLFRPDDVVRWVVTLQHAGDASVAYPALSAALVRDVGGRLPARVMVNWAGPAGSVATVPFEDVHAGTADPAALHDRFVLIGVTDEMKELFLTPVGPMSGVEIHAQAGATMLSGRFICEAPQALGLVVALPACLAIALAGRGRRQWWTWGWAMLVVLVWLGAGAVVFARWLVLLPVTGVALAVVLTAVLTSALHTEAALAALSRLWPGWAREEGEQLEVTVLVCDMAGYTARSETSSPAELMAMMREFFAIVDEVVEPLGGVAARRPGDAALVFFRPKQGGPHHARRALQAARQLKARLAARWPEQDMGFGITLTTGEVSLGWVGRATPEPQILGDPVNVAFRLQSECRARHCPIIADWATATADPEVAAIMRPLGQVEVRNRREPVRIFAPAGD